MILCREVILIGANGLGSSVNSVEDFSGEGEKDIVKRIALLGVPSVADS